MFRKIQLLGLFGFLRWLRIRLIDVHVREWRGGDRTLYIRIIHFTFIFGWAGNCTPWVLQFQKAFHGFGITFRGSGRSWKETRLFVYMLYRERFTNRPVLIRFAFSSWHIYHLVWRYILKGHEEYIEDEVYDRYGGSHSVARRWGFHYECRDMPEHGACETTLKFLGVEIYFDI